MSLKFISICSGIEAASMAWEPLGWSALAFSEIDPFPCAVLAHHYPHVPNLGDMTRFDEWPEHLLAECDVLVGGCPCQAFSVAGLRQSLADARGNLTLVFVKLINHIDAIRVKHGKPPVIIVYENVPGILSTGDNAFGNFLGALSGEDGALEPSGGKWTNAGLVCGPTRDLAWRVLDAQYFGVAQRRRRVFLVGHSRAGVLRPVKVLLVEQGVQRHSAPSREAGQRVAAAPVAGAPSRRGERGAGHDGGVGGVGGVAWGISSDALDRSGEGAEQTAAQRAGLGITEEVSPAIRARPNNSVAHVDIMPTMVSGGSTERSHNQLSGQLREQYIVPVAHVVAPPLTASNDPSRSPQSSEVTQQVEAVLRAQYPEIAEVCGTISDGAHNGGGLNGQDAYTGRILPVAFSFDYGQSANPKATHQFCVEHTAPLIKERVHAVGQINAQDAYTGRIQPVAFDARQSDVCVYGEKTGPLDTDGHTIGVCATGDRTHALTTRSAAEEDGTGRGTPIVPALSVALRGRDGGATAELGGEQASTLRASTGGGDKPHVLTSMAVRRLTPVECERLQGFPDEYTRIPWKNKSFSECPDGPRYKALGNSMAVPCMMWIGKQIQKALA